MIHLSGAAKQYGNKVLYKNASFQINTGEKIGLVGSNGAGKTTIFRILTGEEGLDAGSISKPDKIKIGYFSQNTEEMEGRSVLAEVFSCVGNYSYIKTRLSEIAERLSEPISDDEMAKVLEEYGELQQEFDHLGGYALESRAAEILTGLGIPPEDHHLPTESFSGGWKMRIALAKILTINPDVLLMDEPTNHLDMESILWLENWLLNFKGAVLMTSHDRDFMNRLVVKIVEISNKVVNVYSGNYDFYEKECALRRSQLIATAKRQEKMLSKEHEFISRFAARVSHAAQVQSRLKKLEKIDLVEVPPEEESIHFTWPSALRGGDEVIKIENLGKIWVTREGKEKKVFQGANALVKRLDRVAVVGVNGAGKSTLMKIISGETHPTSGKFVIGSQIEIGYFSQNAMDVLNPDSTILDEVHSRVSNSSLGYLRTLLGALKFSGDEVQKKIRFLSGGEKSRVVLAIILARPVNLLILDEPTNHLDIASREFLLDALKSFQGTVMIVSHDRHFLREITTRVFELDKHQLLVTNGTWDYYLEKKKEKNR